MALVKSFPGTSPEIERRRVGGRATPATGATQAPAYSAPASLQGKLKQGMATPNMDVSMPYGLEPSAMPPPPIVPAATGAMAPEQTFTAPAIQAPGQDATSLAAATAMPGQPAMGAADLSFLDTPQSAAGQSAGRARFMGMIERGMQQNALGQTPLLDAQGRQDINAQRRSDQDWLRGTYGGEALDNQRAARGANAFVENAAAQQAKANIVRGRLQADAQAARDFEANRGERARPGQRASITMAPGPLNASGGSYQFDPQTGRTKMLDRIDGRKRA